MLLATAGCVLGAHPREAQILPDRSTHTATGPDTGGAGFPRAVPMLQMGKLRHRGVQCLAQGNGS